MVKINVFNPVVVVGRGPSWSRKGLVMRSYNPNANPSRFQVQAMVNLANASRQAAGQTTQLSGARRVLEMNRIVSQQLAGQRMVPPGTKYRSVGANGAGFLAAQAAKHGIGYAGHAAVEGPAFGGGAWY